MAYKPKALWDRFNVYYALRVHRARAIKRALSGAGALLAAAWMVATFVRADHEPFNSGPMSVGHALLADQCGACHAPDTRFNRFWISDAEKAQSFNGACLACHEETIGFDDDTDSAWHQVSVAALRKDPNAEEPPAACSACHAEHEGFVRLTAMDDRHCTHCHADLKAKRPDAAYYDRIAFFDAAAGADPNTRPGLHPEFRFKQENQKDPGTIRFNHEVHLRDKPLDPNDPNSPRGIIGPNNRFVVLRCDDCHRAGRSNREWPYANPKTRLDQHQLITDVQSSLQDPFIAPIRFDLHCAACHQPAVRVAPELILASDRTLRDGDVPHGEPGDIRDYVQQRLLAYLDQELAARRKPTDPNNELPAVPETDSAATPSDQTRVKLQFIAEASRALELDLLRPAETHSGPTQRIGCGFCHQIEKPARPADSPIVPSSIPERFFLHASFNHLKHRAAASLEDAHDLKKRATESLGDPNALQYRDTADLDCLSCHMPVMKSRQTVDVSIPGIDSCRACHISQRVQGGGQVNGVGHSCVTCHSFHRAPAADSEYNAASTSAKHGGQE